MGAVEIKEKLLIEHLKTTFVLSTLAKLNQDFSNLAGLLDIYNLIKLWTSSRFIFEYILAQLTMIWECVVVEPLRRFSAARRYCGIHRCRWASIAVRVHVSPEGNATHLQRIDRIVGRQVGTLRSLLLVWLEQFNVLHHAVFDVMSHQVRHLADIRSTHETVRGLTAPVSDQR